jgi:ribokinase
VPAELTVVGSINLDLVARVHALPRAGETVVGTSFARYPGGKGANQAVAAAKLGARVRMVGAVGEDPFAGEALAGLEQAGVELEVRRGGETGIALILVADGGENQIVVVPGANAEVRPTSPGGAVLCQLEVPDAVV